MRRWQHRLLRHPRLRRWHWLVHRLHCCVVCAAVWSELESDPAFVARLRRAEADMEAGRWYSYDTTTGVATPNPDWPQDGPQPR